MDEDTILQIEDLYLNFYTKAGVVKAIDGVTLSIRKGETFGLVGESGCGKSVTANSVMGLIPTPPGKIEKGAIKFVTPVELLKKIGQRKENILDGLLKKIGQRKEKNRGEHLSPENQRMINILKLDRKDIRLIRGKAISMIFQEPMSALNPVFTAGDQISEIILLHEKKELAESMLKKLDEERKRDSAYTKVSMKNGDKGTFHCSSCNATVHEDQTTCPQCGGSFVRRTFRKMGGPKYSFYKRIYTKMVTDPDSKQFVFMSMIPIMRRYQRPMKMEADAKALRMLRLVRIPDPKNVLKSYPHELSGGMQQRVMIAMALACKPQLLIADEPTTALDVTIQAQILKLMQELQDEMGTSILMITHNLGIVAETCSRVGVMYAGSIVEMADKASIFKEPLHPYTQGLMNSIPNVAVQLTRLETIQGNVPNLIKPPSGCRFHTRCPYVMEYCKLNKPENKEVRPGHLVACHLYNGGGSSG